MVFLPPCTPKTCGKEFRRSLAKPSPNYPYGHKTRKPRIVPAFTIQANFQNNTKVLPPPKTDLYKPQPLKPTLFRTLWNNGQFPISIEFTSYGKGISWKVPIEKLDFHHYLPVFIDGIREDTYPCNFIVERGLRDLLTKGAHKILPVVPQLIVPLKKALNTKNNRVMCQALKCIQMMVTGCDRVGEALVPYYRQLLPNFALFKNRNRDLAGVESRTKTAVSRRAGAGGAAARTISVTMRLGANAAAARAADGAGRASRAARSCDVPRRLITGSLVRPTSLLGRKQYLCGAGRAGRLSSRCVNYGRGPRSGHD
ncbi:Parkin coregulated gene protein homolog [Eumeta japonica]|uniref:Parkin coregulated gene protein homolog n=1 Tax=Eumeta variegata TaxID=151549 RepID=A0A4C1YSB3_EUMVA|nr:Parkin coregulated gene protein homolog [Eumeta japonica]